MSFSMNSATFHQTALSPYIHEIVTIDNQLVSVPIKYATDYINYTLVLYILIV